MEGTKTIQDQKALLIGPHNTTQHEKTHHSTRGKGNHPWIVCALGLLPLAVAIEHNKQGAIRGSHILGILWSRPLDLVSTTRSMHSGAVAMKGIESTVNQLLCYTVHNYGTWYGIANELISQLISNTTTTIMTKELYRLDFLLETDLCFATRFFSVTMRITL